MTVNAEVLSSINRHIEVKSNQTKLLVVTKNRTAEDIKKLLLLGQRIFGENKVQEAVNKYSEINREKFSNFELHLIGPLQSNKAKLALETFDVIQTIDRIKIINVLAKLIAENKKFETKKFFIQINIGEENQKSGVLPASVLDLYNYAMSQKLKIIGLMCIPPNNDKPHKYFELMNKIRDTIKMNLLLSMGMSSDFKIAIEHNSNLVRVGSKIFS